MRCKDVKYSGHALKQMFERNISKIQVEKTLTDGEQIVSYPEDKPYLSQRLLGMLNNRPLHVVVAEMETEGICVIITVYVPNSEIWNEDYKTKRTQK